MNWPDTVIDADNLQPVRIGPAPHIAIERRGTGPLVVFLHGVGGNRSNWSAQLAAFEPGFTAVAWDARGYGDSDDYEGALAFADFSADLLRVLDHFDAARAHLVGLSMGGRIALDFCGRHPQRVASLVLADTSGGMPDGPDKERRIEAFLRERKQPLLQGITLRELAPKIVRTLVTPSIEPQRLAQATASLAALRAESYLKTLDEVTRYEGFPAFENLRVPCLVVVGEHDAIASPDYARWMASRIPGARFVMIPGAGHLSNIECPDAFNTAVLGFIRESEQPPSGTNA